MVSLPLRARAGKDSVSPVLVPGLQLRMPRQQLPFRGFTYAPVSPGNQPIRVDWQLLECGNVEGDHIRVHELVEGEGLVTILRDYQAAHAKAVVLINTDETLVLPERVGKMLVGLSGYPVVIITRSSGEQLLECLNTQYKEEELLARLVVESEEKMQEVDEFLAPHNTPFSKYEPYIHQGECSRHSMTPPPPAAAVILLFLLLPPPPPPLSCSLSSYFHSCRASRQISSLLL